MPVLSFGIKCRGKLEINGKDAQNIECHKERNEGKKKCIDHILYYTIPQLRMSVGFFYRVPELRRGRFLPLIWDRNSEDVRP